MLSHGKICWTISTRLPFAEITTRGEGYPTEIKVGQKSNLPKTSFVQADDIYTVSKNRLEKFRGTLDKDSIMESIMRQIEREIENR